MTMKKKNNPLFSHDLLDSLNRHHFKKTNGKSRLKQSEHSVGMFGYAAI